MKKSITAIAVLMLLSVFLSACNLSAANPTQIGPDQINTIAAQTVEALTTQMAPPPATATNTPEPPTATPQVTETPTLLIPTLNLTPGALATNTLIPIATLPGSTECNKVFFLSDVNVPDGTTIKSGATFTKTWKIQNSGSCTWTTLYSAVPFSNDPTSPAISGDNEYRLKANVMPGGILEVSVQMIAPKEEGTYTQVWKMQDDQGNYFGIGGAAGAGWYVNIDVTKTGGTSTAMKYKTEVTSASCDGSGEVTAEGEITLSGTVTGTNKPSYFYRISDNTALKSSTFSDISFSSATTKTASSGTISGLDSGDHNVELYITGGSIATSSLASFEVTCP
jgi:hypothetical protein